jgi:hypothetical protein
MPAIDFPLFGEARVLGDNEVAFTRLTGSLAAAALVVSSTSAMAAGSPVDARAAQYQALPTPASESVQGSEAFAPPRILLILLVAAAAAGGIYAVAKRDKCESPPGRSIRRRQCRTSNPPFGRP